ncbi:hypothetical protein BC826DRAFT_1093533 [Russula brevipes]|nr:hypothetical protein BC826DRAFT_1093533 [Russula brevipes]
MAQWEVRMVHFEGPDLTRVDPQLLPGEREVIPCFHDECCFHANDFKAQAWLRDGQMRLKKKGQGWLIHVSDFITPKTGRLVQLDDDGTIIKDARKIIYPGSNGDPWWDNEQLIAQIHWTITILRGQTPGVLRKQKDTIIPQTNPSVEQCGNTQKMMHPDGWPKGLQTVLEEYINNVRGMKAKCSPYWGWCKYRYCEEPKKTFATTKACAIRALDYCPVDAAEWAVKRQKQHWQVSQHAMMSIEAVLNNV